MIIILDKLIASYEMYLSHKDNWQHRLTTHGNFEVFLQTEFELEYLYTEEAV